MRLVVLRLPFALPASAIFEAKLTAKSLIYVYFAGVSDYQNSSAISSTKTRLRRNHLTKVRIAIVSLFVRIVALNAVLPLDGQLKHFKLIN